MYICILFQMKECLLSTMMRQIYKIRCRAPPTDSTRSFPVRRLRITSSRIHSTSLTKMLPVLGSKRATLSALATLPLLLLLLLLNSPPASAKPVAVAAPVFAPSPQFNLHGIGSWVRERMDSIRQGAPKPGKESSSTESYHVGSACVPSSKVARCRSNCSAKHDVPMQNTFNCVLRNCAAKKISVSEECPYGHVNFGFWQKPLGGS